MSSRVVGANPSAHLITDTEDSFLCELQFRKKKSQKENMLSSNSEISLRHLVDRDESGQVKPSKYCLHLNVQSAVSFPTPKCRT